MAKTRRTNKYLFLSQPRTNKARGWLFVQEETAVGETVVRWCRVVVSAW